MGGVGPGLLQAIGAIGLPATEAVLNHDSLLPRTLNLPNAGPGGAHPWIDHAAPGR